MTQYIDKDALVAEIEKRIKQFVNENNTLLKNSDNAKELRSRIIMCKEVLSFIRTLEVKEVNFKCPKSVFEGQYLTKDKVVATIERLQDECEEQGNNNGVELLEKLFNKIDTIEVKEVDLDFQTFAKEMKSVFSLPSPKTENIEEEPLNWEYAIAKHFFELGVNSQEEK